VPLQPDVLLVRFDGVRSRRTNVWTCHCPCDGPRHVLTITRGTTGYYRFACEQKHSDGDVCGAVDLPLDDVTRPRPDDTPVTGTEPARITLTQRIIAAGDYRPPKLDPLVKNWLNQRGLAFMFGQPKTGKSLFALDLVCSVTAGLDWVGLPTAQMPSALYIAAEAPWTFGDRYAGWVARHGDARPNISVLPEAPRLTDPGVRRDLLALAASGAFQIVVFDTLARCTPGVDENSAKEMGAIVELLAEMAQHCLVVVVHHGRKNGGGMRGTSALLAAADTVLEARRVGRAVSIGPVEQRSLPIVDDRVVMGIAEPGVLVDASEVDDAPPPPAEVLAVLVDGMTRRQWIDAVAEAFGEHGAQRRVRNAIEQGLAENRGSRQAGRFYRAQEPAA
jgi:hypothetical protein